MPTFTRGDATIYYEEYGSGFPLLTFAPGGLMSTIDFWRRPNTPMDPTRLFASEFRVIAMDQRNAGGRSHAPISASDGWHTYTADHVALLDHLGIEKCHLFGQCIGGPFILGLLKAQPERVASAVIVQPIGRIGPMPAEPSANFQSWAEIVKDRPDVTLEVLAEINQNLYGPGFAYSVDRESIARCTTPCLVFAGNDPVHPFAYAQQLAGLLPNSDFIPEWRQGEALEAAKTRIFQFLREWTPVAA